MTDQQTYRIDLDERCGIGAVTALRDEILKALDARGECVIGCAQVRAIDAATLQLLVAARLSADRATRSLRFDAPSEEFLQAADYLGLRAQFC